MFRIGKRFRFEAAHAIPGLSEGHKCGRPHGHSYIVEILLAADGELTGPGFVVDFAELQPVRVYLDATFDHQDITSVLGVAATSEHLARHLCDWCSANLVLPPGVVIDRVRVSETESTFAEYIPGTP